MSHKKSSTISRREFLKFAGSTAVAAAAGGVLSACGPAATPTAAPAAAATTAPAVVSGGEKTLTLAIQAFAHDAMKPVIAEWEASSGFKVNLESGPTTGQEMMTKYAPAFQSGTAQSMCSVSTTCPTGLRRAGWLEPLDTVIGGDLE
jgi:ABC-type glycerol-3-phosphate transport system substrate-binding protein